MRRALSRLVLVLLLSVNGCASDMRTPLPEGPGKQVAVFVALCDNVHQGIAPVPAAIGNGEEPARNLYWGCSEALPQVMRASRDWARPVWVKSYRGQPREVLQAVVCTRADKRATISAFAYRGDAMQACLRAFEEELQTGRYELVVFLGHNGLMDFHCPEPTPATKQGADSMVLCCHSHSWFASRLEALKSRPVLLTRQNMYPAGALVTAALEAWLSKPSDTEYIRAAAARAYAANQGISVKAAAGVFAKLP